MHDMLRGGKGWDVKISDDWAYEIMEIVSSEIESMKAQEEELERLRQPK